MSPRRVGAHEGVASAEVLLVAGNSSMSQALGVLRMRLLLLPVATSQKWSIFANHVINKIEE
jgi:hypothetical protein